MDSDRICSLAIAGQHLSIIRQVHGLCLGGTSQRITNGGNGIQNMGASYAFLAHQQIVL